MEQLTRMPLSGSTNGEPVHITATTTGAAHTVHTAPAKGYDLVYIYAGNIHSDAVVVSIEWTTSGVTGRMDISVFEDAALDDPIINGLYLRNSATVKAFAGTTAVINLVGRVERYE